MLDVFLTIDVEIWCGGWTDLDRKFADAYTRYVYGQTASGDYGLPFQLRLLNQHGLEGIFFVETLFAKRFGTEPLSEIVGLINDAKQEVQLHVHTEWVDEAEALVGRSVAKRQLLRMFSAAEQTSLIGLATRMIQNAGARAPNAFRAGSFGFNLDTLRAVAANGIAFDASYNAALFGLDSGVLPDSVVYEPVDLLGVSEYPMTVFRDGFGSLRHAQLGACSGDELESVLWKALEQNRKAFVILSHSFELLNQRKDAVDKVVLRRMERLCRFLDRHRDCFRTRGFHGLSPKVVQAQPPPLSCSFGMTSRRALQQIYRRTYG